MDRFPALNFFNKCGILFQDLIELQYIQKYTVQVFTYKIYELLDTILHMNLFTVSHQISNSNLIIFLFY